MKLDLSLVVITLNEEINIARCIKSVPFAKEIIVLDSGSIDNTVKIAKDLGAKVYSQEWLGFGAQKQKALSYATSSWLLFLDADEWLSEGLQSEIKEVIINPNSENVFSIKRLSSYLGKKIYHGGWYPDYQTRLFRKGFAYWNNESIHEKLKTDEKIYKLQNILYHIPFTSIKDQIIKNYKYATLIADKKIKNGREIKSVFYIIYRTILRFIENFIIKSGYKDGLVGFIIAFNSAQSYMIQSYLIYQHTKKERG